MRFGKLSVRYVLAAAAVASCAWLPGGVFGSPSTEEVKSVQGEPAWRGPLVSEVKNDRRELYAWLQASRVQAKADKGFTLDLSPRQRSEIGEVGFGAGRRAIDKRLRVGVSEPVNQEIRFDTMGSKGGVPAHGAVSFDGSELVWTVAVTSAKASALRMHLKGFHLPEGAALYVYNDYGQAFGPYTGSGPLATGEFWTHAVFGSKAYMQLHYQGARDARALADLRFTLASIAHIGTRFLLPRYSEFTPGAKAFCPDNASCVENASCGIANSDIEAARDGVALILFQSGPWYYICSGGLLADTDTATQIPYFLTANHCLSTDTEAASMETYFNYTTQCGDHGSGSCSIPDTYSTLGATVLATNNTSDYTLMELSQPPPTGAAFLGWTNTEVAFSNGTGLYRISHPSGSPQAYSEHDVDTNKGTCSSWPRGDWIYSTDTYGATEGGSSGSPVLNASGQVVGQLSGACGFNVNDECDTVSNATVDGALSAYYTAVSQYLDPTDGGGDPPSDVQASVGDIAVTTRSQGPWNRGVATITVVDDNGSPVPNATVSGDFTGDLSGSGSAVTDSNGVAIIESDRTRSGISTLQFCVNNITGSGISYDPAGNVEECDSLGGDGGGGGTTEDVTVASVELSTRSRGPWTNGVATVNVVDSSNSPVANATVTGTFSNGATGTASATTDSAGVAVLESDRTREPIGSFDFCVNDVTGTGINYVPGTEACGT